ncbi:hypothetical protein EMCRGX_G024445 [Ephydatia muelleri]
MLGPFFPIEAEGKGAPSIVVGGVASTYPACVVILSPIFGYYLPKVGVKFCLLAGILLFGGSNILFAFLYWLSGMSFTIFSFLLAFVGGIGSSMLQTATYALVGILFKGRYGLTMGLTEVVVGIGYAAGPAVAGSLYEIGGFMLPFLVVGSIPLVFLPFLYITIASPTNQMDGESHQLSIQTIGHILKSCVIICLVLSIIVEAMSFSYSTPIFSPFMYHQFHLSVFEIGLIGLIDAVTYVVLCLVTGPLYDRLPPKPFIVIGLVLCSIACFLIGPAPYISKPRLWLTMVADGILGVGGALIVSPIYPALMQEAKSHFPELSTDSVAMFVSGIIPAAISCGELIGPLVAGGLDGILSFEECSALFGEVCLAMAILLLAVIILDRLLSAKTVKEPDIRQQLEESGKVKRNYNTFLNNSKDTTWTIL